MAGNNKMAFLRPRRAIRTAVVVAKTLIVEATRMAPFLVIFAVGAVGTFFVNVLRIVSICTLWVNVGPEAAQMFHTYYGELYFIVWIMLYLSAIFFGPKILTKLANIRRKTD